MNILTFPNKKEASKKAHKLIEESKKNGAKVFGMATGETPKTLYKMLSKSTIDFTDCISINLDEFYGINPKQPESYHAYMNEHLFKSKPFKESYIPDGLNYNLEDEIKKYDQILKKYPRDLQLLGLGVNGHIGFNEPGTSFEHETHLIQLSSDTLRNYNKYFENMKEAPRYAYTMGIKSIMEADKIVLMAFGASKAKAVKEMVDGPLTKKVPASILQEHKDVVVLLDKEASRLLYDD